MAFDACLEYFSTESTAGNLQDLGWQTWLHLRYNVIYCMRLAESRLV